MLFMRPLGVRSGAVPSTNRLKDQRDHSSSTELKWSRKVDSIWARKLVGRGFS